jgi:ribose 1,5-bisphosphate isomerase
MNIPEEVKQIIKDIEDVRIQGATAVAESSFEGIKIYLGGYIDRDVSFEVFMADVEKVGLQLVNARPNEPLARNGLKYLLNTYRVRYPQIREIPQAREHLVSIMDEFLDLLSSAKSQITEVGVSNFADKKGLMTHCHSSTVENVCKGIAERRGDAGFSVVATETRPLFQGRITAKNLVEAGLDVKMVVDSAVTSFLVGHWDIPVEAVFIGCDEIAVNGDTVNKIGSYGVALSAYYAGKPVYVVGTLLKLDPSTIYDRPRIEMRDGKEIWPDAPEGLTIINPAFEIIPASFITGFITEFGVITPENVERELGKHYDWLW